MVGKEGVEVARGDGVILSREGEVGGVDSVHSMAHAHVDDALNDRE